ncbi:MAG: tryptophan-rich sensory protein [Chloroflexi bacterium]|nr:tryptophan-rich sensory protein [Chloroflexota bacterium]
MGKSVSVQKLVVSILVCLFVGFIGSFLTSPSMSTWYATLIEPPFTPPGGVFGPVWSTLFALMGVSVYLVWHEGLENKGVKPALSLFVLLLLLNIAWSVLFFGSQSPFSAFIGVIVLWVVVALSVRSFLGISRPAGLLLVPYLLWVTFTVFLTFSVWQLNP